MSSNRKIFNKWSVLATLLLAILTLVWVTYLWLFSSSSGAGWLWDQVEDTLAGTIHAARVEGDLAEGFVIHGLRVDSDGMEISIGRIDVEARLGVWPLSIQVQKLLFHDVDISTATISPASDPSDPTAIGDIIEAMTLPVPLQAHHVELREVTLRESDVAPVSLVRSLSFKLKLDDRLEIEQLQLSSDVFAATAAARLTLKPPFKLQASLEGQLEFTTAPGAEVLNLPVVLKGTGDLENIQLQLNSSHVGLDVNGQLLRPFTELEWDVSGFLQQSPQKLSVAGEEIDLSGLRLTSKGHMDDWSSELSTDLKFSNQNAATLVISAVGSDTGIQINHSSLKGAGLNLGISGRLNWSDQPEANINAVIEQLDISPWIQEWPEAEYLAGELDIEWSVAGLKIPTGRLGVSGTELAIDVKADIDLENNRVDGSLGWRHLSWPLKVASPAFDSPSGQLDINGSIDQWTTAGLIDLKLGEYPQGRFQIQGSGDRYSSHVELLDGEILGGRLSGVADANWKDGLSWELDLLGRGLDPEPLATGWPGRMDVDFGVRADSSTGQFKVAINSLQGMLRGTLVKASGKLEFFEENIAFEQFDVRTDDATLHLDGNAMEPAGVTAKFSGLLPSGLLQGASGGVEMEARFSSHAGSAGFEMQMQALDFVWDGLGVKALTVTTGESISGELLPGLDLNASGLSIQGEVIDELSLSIRPDDQSYAVDARLVSEILDMSASVDLVPENVADMLHGSWAGVLNDMNMLIGNEYKFELVDSSNFSWSPASFLLESACLHAGSDAGVCLGIGYQDDSDFSFTADVTALPVDYLSGLFELDVRFEQLLEGRLEWRQSNNRAPAGGADFRITAGRILDLVDNEAIASSSEGVFGFVLRDGNLESGVLDIGFPGVGFIDIDFDVLDIVSNGEKKIKGSMVSQLDDIKLAGDLFFPGADGVGGQFESNIRLKGTVSDPVFEGGFRLANGFFHYAPIGLKLEDIGFSGTLDSRDRGTLKGQFMAGEGIGSLDGRLMFASIDRIEIDLAFSGDKLLLVNTENLKLVTETDLQVGISPQRIDINGHIHVPTALLAPSNLLIEKVGDSEDLVMETRGAEMIVSDGEAPPQNKVFGMLEVSLGEGVEVMLPGVETSVSGSVLYTWSGDHVPLAEGSYAFKGQVDVYGPTLTIDNGSISFPGIPANNPLLNIRAQRDIFGNTQIRSAGVQVIGSLKRPVVEAYTVPVTNEDRAWTLLVTGSDFDQSQGVGGFDVGTYIAPKLYVSYGISLFEDENVVSARYDLKKGFGIKVTSGQRETGLDVSYTIDR